MAVNLLPPDHQGRMHILAILVSVIGDHAAVGHDNLLASRVHSDAPIQVAMLFFDHFGTNIKNVAA
jgi:hypothetical protein